MSVMLFSENIEYNKGMSMVSNMLGVFTSIYTGQWKFSEIKRPVHVENCFQLSGKPSKLAKTSHLRRY